MLSNKTQEVIAITEKLIEHAKNMRPSIPGYGVVLALSTDILKRLKEMQDAE